MQMLPVSKHLKLFIINHIAVYFTWCTVKSKYRYCWHKCNCLWSHWHSRWSYIHICRPIGGAMVHWMGPIKGGHASFKKNNWSVLKFLWIQSWLHTEVYDLDRDVTRNRHNTLIYIKHIFAGMYYNAITLQEPIKSNKAWLSLDQM